MDVSKSTKQLVDTQLDEDHRYPLAEEFCVVTFNVVDSLRDELEHQVQVNLVVAVACVETVEETDDIPVAQLLHDLKFTVLVSPVLQDFLDGNGLVRVNACCLEDDTKRALSDDSVSVVCDVVGLDAESLMLPSWLLSSVPELHGGP